MAAPSIGISPSLEFWFDFGSSYSYLSVMRIEALAKRHGVSIMWKPFLLGPIFKSFGWDNSPFVLQEAKGAYAWRDIARRCEKYDLPWRQPTRFPRNGLLLMRIALLGAEQAWIGDYCKRIMRINFVDDRDIDTADVASEVLTALGLSAADLIAAAQSDQNKLRLRAQTEQARQRGIFGAPTFFVGDEMFWGDDRLEDALAWASQRRS
jgi:2-hydroxychromene-2-carboxylate isomerase